MRSVAKDCVLILALATAMLAHGQAAERPFSLTISTAHEIVKKGTPIIIEIAFKNTSDHDIRRARRPEGPTHGELLGFPPIVRDAEGKEPPLTKRGRLILGRPAPGVDDGDIYYTVSAGATWLHPGQVITPVIKLSDLYDLTAPGKYSVQVWHYDVEHKEAVKSNAITVTVTP